MHKNASINDLSCDSSITLILLIDKTIDKLIVRMSSLVDEQYSNKMNKVHLPKF